MKRAALVMVVAISGCGRIGFDPLAQGDAPGSPDVASDAALGAWSAPTPVALPVTANDDDPTLTADRLDLLFNRNGNQIFESTRTAIGQPWSVPAYVAELSLPGSGTVPEVFDDGLGIYYASTRAGGPGGLDIWSAARPTRAAAWTSFAPRAEVSTAANDFTGAMTADRMEMVMSTTTSTTDLVSTTRTSPTGMWTTPIAITGLDTAINEDEAFITADGLALYYTRNNVDLYVARRPSRTVPFSAGVPIPELDSTGSDRDAWVSADERYIMFSSDRSGQFLLYEASR